MVPLTVLLVLEDPRTWVAAAAPFFSKLVMCVRELIGETSDVVSVWVPTPCLTAILETPIPI